MLLDDGHAETGDQLGRIRRPRLERRLTEAASAQLAIVIGPAGAGKSELLRGLCDDPAPIYMRAGRSRGTFARFVHGLAQSCVVVAPGAVASFPRAWERALQSRSPSTELAHWLCGHLGGTDRHLIIDDLYEAAVDPNVTGFIAKFAELRPGTRLTIATRSAGMLPIALWMATGRLDRPLDHADLAFTHDEVRALAEQSKVFMAADAIDQIVAATGGSPIAVAYALARSRVLPLDGTSGDTPVAFSAIAGQIFSRRTRRERAFLFTAALFPTIDDELLARSGWDDAREVRAAMRADAAFMWDAADDGALRFHDRFRDHLALAFGSLDLGFQAIIGHRAVDSLAMAGLYAHALDVAAQQHLAGSVGDLLESHGFEIVESGAIDVVSEALATIEATDDVVGARAMALRGYMEARSGKLDTSEAWFRLGLNHAHDERTRVTIAMYYARELSLRRREDACEVLAEFADSTTIDRSLLVDVRSAYGQALTAAGRIDEACRHTDEAVAFLDDHSPAALRARVLARAAYVAIEAGQVVLARERAMIAAPLAEANALYDVAASTYSVLYNLAYEIDDDSRASLEYLRRVRDLGVKSGTLRLETYALLGMYELYAELGDGAALDALDIDLLTVDKHDATVAIVEGLLPAKALRATWNGGFATALQLVRSTAEHEGTPLREALAWARIALYASAAGDDAQAQTAMHRADRDLLETDASTTQFGLTIVTLALAALVGGDAESARRRLARADAAALGHAERLRALRAAVAALITEHDGSTDDFAGLADDLTTLRETSFGGMAALIEALPYPFSGSRRHTETIGHRLAARTAQVYVQPMPAVISLVDDIDAVLDALFEGLDSVAPLMAEHSRAVSAWCSRLGRVLGLSEAEIAFVTRCGLVHDVGKMRTPTEILNAPRALTAQEWAVMQDHAAEGGRILGQAPMLRAFVPIVRGHHERIDGKGYPDGLRAGAIPLAARIVSVADSFNAMIGRRPYRLPLPPTTALDELERNRGTQFDPEVVDAMVRIVTGRFI